MSIGNLPSIQVLLVVFALLSASLLAGCSTSPSYHDVDFDGSITVEDNSFKMVGKVDVGSGAQPEATFENVTIALYTEDRNHLSSIRVGTLSTTSSNGPMEQQVNISTNTVPSYVIIESKDFWSSDAEIQVVSYYRNGNEYEEYFRRNKGSKFPDESG